MKMSIEKVQNLPHEILNISKWHQLQQLIKLYFQTVVKDHVMVEDLNVFLQDHVFPYPLHTRKIKDNAKKKVIDFNLTLNIALAQCFCNSAFVPDKLLTRSGIIPRIAVR